MVLAKMQNRSTYNMQIIQKIKTMAELFRKGAYELGAEIISSAGKIFRSKKAIKNAGVEPKKDNTYWEEVKPDYESQYKELSEQLLARDKTIAEQQQQIASLNGQVSGFNQLVTDLQKQLNELQKPTPDPTPELPPQTEAPVITDYTGAVVSLEVVDTATDKVEGQLVEGSSISPLNLAFKATTQVDGKPANVGSLVWELIKDGKVIKKTEESGAPYAFPSNEGANYAPLNPAPAPGEYELRAVPYDSSNKATRKPGTPIIRKFSIALPEVVKPVPSGKGHTIHLFGSRASANVEAWAAKQPNVKVDWEFIGGDSIVNKAVAPNKIDVPRFTNHLRNLKVKPGTTLLHDLETPVFLWLNGTDEAKVRKAEPEFYTLITEAKRTRPDLKHVIYGIAKQFHYENQKRPLSRYDRLIQAGDGVCALVYIHYHPIQNQSLFGKRGHEGNKEMIRRNIAYNQELAQRHNKPVTAIIYNLVHPTNDEGLGNHIIENHYMNDYVQTILAMGVTDVLLWTPAGIADYNKGGVDDWCPQMETREKWDNLVQIPQMSQWIALTKL